VARGSVNLNGVDEVLIEAAFEGMPSRHTDSANSIAATDVDAIVQRIVALQDQGVTFTNTHDLCEIGWQTTALLQDRDSLDLEAMLAYSHGLLGTRNNLFIIIAAASPATAAIGSFAAEKRQVQALGEKRAIAQIWRDPFPNADGRHECFVQFFKWVE